MQDILEICANLKFYVNPIFDNACTTTNQKLEQLILDKLIIDSFILKSIEIAAPGLQKISIFKCFVDNIEEVGIWDVELTIGASVNEIAFISSFAEPEVMIWNIHAEVNQGTSQQYFHFSEMRLC